MNVKQSLENKEELQWLIDFANMDLEKIKPGDKAKLLEESDILFPKTEITAVRATPLSADLSTSSKTKANDQNVLISLDWFLTEKDKRILKWAYDIPKKDSNEYWSIILQAQEGIKNLFFEFCLNFNNSVFHRAIKMVIHGDHNPKLGYDISYFPLTNSHIEYLSFKILRLLDGLPGNAIRQCPECKKIFLHTSLREKKFCSPQCLWKSNAAKRRKEDPEGYKKYQRELMKDRYREKTGNRHLKTKSRKQKKEG